MSILFSLVLVLSILFSCVENHTDVHQVNNSHKSIIVDTIDYQFNDTALYRKIENFHENLDLKLFIVDSVITINNEHNPKQIDSLFYYSKENLSISYYKSSYNNKLFLYSLYSLGDGQIKELSDYLRTNFFDFKNLNNKNVVKCRFNTDVYSLLIIIDNSGKDPVYEFFVYNLFI